MVVGCSEYAEIRVVMGGWGSVRFVGVGLCRRRVFLLEG